MWKEKKIFKKKSANEESIMNNKKLNQNRITN